MINFASPFYPVGTGIPPNPIARKNTLSRSDVEDADLFALVGALARIHDQPSLSPRADHLFGLIAGAILTSPSKSDVVGTTDSGLPLVD